MSENDENLTTEEETSSETTVEETSEAKTSLGAVVDNSSGKQLPEKIATVNTEKPHVKFTVDEGNLPVKAIVNCGSKIKPSDEYPHFNHYNNLCFKHCHDPYYNSHHTSCYHAYDSGNTVLIPYSWKGGLPMVKVGGHTEFFDLNKPMLISDLGCNICDCY
ncbi:hypothetical protein [Wolbachia endosymbiont of Tettigetta isshikii]|uniref:hypothetical protein n=1 Tax=Wolbachia endosymbiont of Tettigetta isshikii TaxID=3239093 RepID=UPI00397F9811